MRDRKTTPIGRACHPPFCRSKRCTHVRVQPPPPLHSSSRSRCRAASLLGYGNPLGLGLLRVPLRAVGNRRGKEFPPWNSLNISVEIFGGEIFHLSSIFFSIPRQPGDERNLSYPVPGTYPNNPPPGQRLDHFIIFVDHRNARRSDHRKLESRRASVSE